MAKNETDEIVDRISRQIVLCQKRVLTLGEAASYMGVSASHVYKLTSQRKIPFARPTGKNIFFEREQLEQWLLQNRVSSLNELSQQARAHEHFIIKKGGHHG